MPTPDEKLAAQIRADFPSALLYLNHCVLQGEHFDVSLAAAASVFNVDSAELDEQYGDQFKARAYRAYKLC
jgi:hypothetical protein